MPTIYIDNQPYTVAEGQNLLQACLGLGFNVPYFCWHPAMGSVGACRQCAVKQFRDENDQRGRIVMACMTPAQEGIRISIDDPEVRQFRASVIEWLMVNHPHDCPVCDEGGECHLQDMTVMTGHNYRPYHFNKRTHRNQQLGPFVNHEMNRCIQCYRCVRFYHDYAGGRDLNVFGCHDHVYFGRAEDGILESEFAGNLVEICPTGVFTDKSFKHHYTRKWDLQTAPSVCVHCSLGCNTLPGERFGELRRIRNRYHHEINGYFLCDRGRYGYAFVNSAQRIRRPQRRMRKADALQPIPPDIALAMAGAMLRRRKPVIGIGSPRASLEANFMLRMLSGPEYFYAGVTDDQWRLLGRMCHILQQGPAHVPSLQQAATADAVFLLGENVPDTAPLLALRLRHLTHVHAARIARQSKIPAWSDAGIREVAQQEKETLFIATPYPTRLDSEANVVCRAHPRDLARLGFRVASLLDPAAPKVEDLPYDLRATAAVVARALQKAERPMIVSGSGCRSLAIIEAAANITRALAASGEKSRLLYTFDECNSFGLGLLGSRGGLESALKALQNGEAETVVILENNLFHCMDGPQAEALFTSARHVISLDHLRHSGTERSDLVLPTAAFAESSGTLVNNEGRAQRFFQVFEPAGEVRAAWRWLRDMMAAGGRPQVFEIQHLDDVLAAIAEALPVLQGLRQAAPDAQFRIVGRKIPRQSHRYSGRTAMHADVAVHEFPPPEDPDAPLVFSMEGHDEPQPPAAVLPRFWRPGWNSVQALNKFQQEIAGTLHNGCAGQRLIGPPVEPAGTYFPVPPQSTLAQDQWHLTPIYHVFGSEALSALSQGIAALAPAPYVALSPDDAAALGFAAGTILTVSVGEAVRQLPLRLLPGLAPRTVGLPVGLQDLPWPAFSENAKIKFKA